MCRRWRYYRSSVSCPETPWHVEVDWESNRQPFGSYTTALPTEPQPFKKKTALLSQDEANQVRDNKRKHLHHKGWVLHSCLKNLRLFLSPQRNSLKWCSKPWTKNKSLTKLKTSWCLKKHKYKLSSEEDWFSRGRFVHFVRAQNVLLLQITLKDKMWCSVFFSWQLPHRLFHLLRRINNIYQIKVFSL